MTNLAAFSVSNKKTISYQCLNNKDWRMTQINGACNEVIGYPSQTLISNEISIGKIIEKLDADEVWEKVQSALTCKLPFQLCYRIKTQDEGIKTIFDVGEGIFIKNKLVELRGFISDVTPYFIQGLNQDISQYFEAFSSEILELMKKNHSPYFNCKLSHREIETLIYLCKGMTMKEIGNQLTISSRTVEVHINRLKLKLHCYSRSELKNLFFRTSIGRKILMLI